MLTVALTTHVPHPINKEGFDIGLQFVQDGVATDKSIPTFQGERGLHGSRRTGIEGHNTVS